MNGMTTQERLTDIVKRSGLSEAVVRRVLDAERESIVSSLRKGERATLIGRCTIRPELRQKLSIGGGVNTFVKIKVDPSNALQAMLSDLHEFDEPDEPISEEVREHEEFHIIAKQISALI